MGNPTFAEGLTSPGERIAEFPLPWGRLVLSLQGSPPGWVQPVLKRIGQLLTLADNWDSYGGRRIDPVCAWSTWQLLLAILRDDSPTPTLVPTTRGGMQIEWHIRGIDLEVDVVSPGKLLVSFDDATTGQCWEREVTNDLGGLAESVAALGRVEGNGRV